MKTEHEVEPKENFYRKIEKYYTDLAGDEIPADLMKELILKISDDQYDRYNRFWNQYPKSRKRYSEFKTADLEHSFTEYDITNFFKSKASSTYREFSKILLKMNDEEFRNFETRKYQYENK